MFHRLFREGSVIAVRAARLQDQPPPRVVRWVKGYVARETRVSLILAAALLAFGLVALVFTYAFWYFVVSVLSAGLMNLAAGVKLALAAAIVGLLFVLERTTDMEELHRLEFETDAKTRVAIGVAQVSGYGYLAPLMGAGYASSSVKIAAIIFLIAPQAIHGAVRLVRRSQRVSRLDIDDCARVLTILLTADGKKSFQELATEAPNVDWEALVPLLRDMLGVVFLFTPPEGLTVADHLREEIVGKR